MREFSLSWICGADLSRSATDRDANAVQQFLHQEMQGQSLCAASGGIGHVGYDLHGSDPCVQEQERFLQAACPTRTCGFGAARRCLALQRWTHTQSVDAVHMDLLKPCRSRGSHLWVIEPSWTQQSAAMQANVQVEIQIINTCQSDSLSIVSARLVAK